MKQEGDGRGVRSSGSASIRSPAAVHRVARGTVRWFVDPKTLQPVGMMGIGESVSRGGASFDCVSPCTSWRTSTCRERRRTSRSPTSGHSTPTRPRCNERKETADATESSPRRAPSLSWLCPVWLPCSASRLQPPPDPASTVPPKRARFQIAWTHSNGPWDTNGEILVMNADGSGQRNLSRHPAHDSDAGVVAGRPENRLPQPPRRQARDLRRERGRHRTPKTDEQPKRRIRPAWSPDGRKIAFLRLLRQRGGLYVMNADGSGQRRLTYARGWIFLGGAAWSPDGRLLAFSASNGGHAEHAELYVINADGSKRRNLTRNPAHDVFRAWSPDGRIVFDQRPHRQRRPLHDQRRRRRAGNLSRSWGQDVPRSPWWPWAVLSPSGEKVFFVRGGGSTGSLYVMNADGSGRRKLVETMQGDILRSGRPTGGGSLS